MVFHDYLLLGNPLSQWATAAGLVAAALLAVLVFKRILIRRLAAIAEHTSTRIDNSLADALGKTRLWLWVLPALALGARSLVVPERAFEILQAGAMVSLFVQLGLWLGQLLHFWIENSRRVAQTSDPAAATSLGAMGFIGQVLLWSILLLVMLDNLGVDVTALVAGLGVGGIAVALATQNILGDLFASMSIVVDKPFVLGDFIIVDEYMGTVEKIGLKTTRIRSLGGEQLVFSNADLLNSRVRNYKRMVERRVVFRFGVVYQTPPEQMAAIPSLVAGIVQAQEPVRFDRAHFVSFGDSSLDFEVVYWVLRPEYNLQMDIQQAINLALLSAFLERGIEFAYPTRTLIVEGTPPPMAAA
jgi:small-conductance mechanosensitive channel